MQIQTPKIPTYEETNAMEFIKGLVLIVLFLALIAPFVVKFYKYF